MCSIGKVVTVLKHCSVKMYGDMEIKLCTFHTLMQIEVRYHFTPSNKVFGIMVIRRQG
jgi:hypothetical protein